MRDLRTSFITEAGELVAVDGVSMQIPSGKTVALVGESGCGKSVTALSIMRLIPQPPGRIVAGQVLLDTATPEEHADASLGTPPTTTVDLLQVTEKQMRKIRGRRIAMIFQEPMTSLNPVYTIGEQIVEAIELHQPLRGKAARAQAVEMLRKVGIAAPKERAGDYPHHMSGGMLQRVMIAMALSCQPSLLIADEPTTALDVTIQLQILELLRSLQAESQMSVLLITHDLGVVAQVADYVYVMYAGRIIEHASATKLLSSPLHPYTQGLLRCMPRLSQRREPGRAGRAARPAARCDTLTAGVAKLHQPYRLSRRRERLEVIPGQVPDPADWPCGCRFHPRCGLTAQRAGDPGRAVVPIVSEAGDAVLKRCVQTYEVEPSGTPELREVQPGHYVACWEADSTL